MEVRTSTKAPARRAPRSMRRGLRFRECGFQIDDHEQRLPKPDVQLDWELHLDKRAGAQGAQVHAARLVVHRHGPPANRHPPEQGTCGMGDINQKGRLKRLSRPAANHRLGNNKVPAACYMDPGQGSSAHVSCLVGARQATVRMLSRTAPALRICICSASADRPIEVEAHTCISCFHCRRRRCRCVLIVRDAGRGHQYGRLVGRRRQEGHQE